MRSDLLNGTRYSFIRPVWVDGKLTAAGDVFILCEQMDHEWPGGNLRRRRGVSRLRSEDGHAGAVVLTSTLEDSATTAVLYGPAKPPIGYGAQYYIYNVGSEDLPTQAVA